MTPVNTPEVWLRGPLPDVPPLLQPVAHALLQAREEVITLMNGFPDELLWERPRRRTAANQSSQSANAVPVASVGFHLQHLTGVLDRLFTYARGETLSTSQLTALAQEGKDDPESPVTVTELVRQFNAQVDMALAQLRRTDERTLTDGRMVGRAQLPSTVIGLLVHSAEHTTRHVGQLLVTVRWVS